MKKILINFLFLPDTIHKFGLISKISYKTGII